jgi:hypothetical protein
MAMKNMARIKLVISTDACKCYVTEAFTGKVRIITLSHLQGVFSRVLKSWIVQQAAKSPYKTAGSLTVRIFVAQMP